MYPKQEISGTSPVPSAFIHKPVRFDTTEPHSLQHSNLEPKIQEVALSITQMFASAASSVTWKRFYTFANLLEMFGQSNRACDVRTLILEYSSTIQYQYSSLG